MKEQHALQDVGAALAWDMPEAVVQSVHFQPSEGPASGESGLPGVPPQPAVTVEAAAMQKVGRGTPVALPAPKQGTSHHSYAKAIVEQLSVDGHQPVFYQGDLYVIDRGSALWVPMERDEILRTVAERFDGRKNCIRHADYCGITDQIQAITRSGNFFSAAPVGTACVGSFYFIAEDRLRSEPLCAAHRQRVMLDVSPARAATPLFDQFLHQTFRSEVPGEEQEQVRLVQEIAGAVLLGIMPRYQKAALFYDPYGRAGKGTMERIIRQLVPQAFTSAVSPFKWNNEYYRASLVGSRLNVVGELPDGDPIPAADFKAVTGGDLLSSRQPTRPVVSFVNEAAHLFTSNHLITTRDHSEAFYVRWLLVEFPNSLLRLGLTPVPGLAEQIIAQELAGIAHWAMEGGIRLLKQGRFSPSMAHDRLMEKWRRTSSSVDEFIHECCEVKADLTERRSTFYVSYKAWCQDNGRKPVSKGKVKELMEHSVGLPVRFSTLDGIEVLRGIAVDEAYKDRLTSL